jgi:hypothetical protein
VHAVGHAARVGHITNFSAARAGHAARAGSLDCTNDRTTPVGIVAVVIVVIAGNAEY